VYPAVPRGGKSASKGGVSRVARERTTLHARGSAQKQESCTGAPRNGAVAAKAARGKGSVLEQCQVQTDHGGAAARNMAVMKYRMTRCKMSPDRYARSVLVEATEKVSRQRRAAEYRIDSVKVGCRNRMGRTRGT